MKTISYFKYCSISLFIFVISGCATPMNMSSVELNDLAPNEGIVVGSLIITGGEGFWGPGDWELIAKNDEDSTFMPKVYSITAKGDGGEGIFATKLPAGNYTFLSLIQIGALGIPMFTTDANFSFTVQPGEPLYIGRLVVRFSPGTLNTYSTQIYYNVVDAKDDIAEKAKNLYDIDLNDTTSSLAKIN